MIHHQYCKLVASGSFSCILLLSGSAFAYGEKDAIRDCEKRIRNEYKLSDLRDANARQIMDMEHHYQVKGQTKIDGKKYPWSCEVKKRHVTTVDYSGPEPEGIGTAEKLAIGAAAAIAVGAAASALSKDKAPPQATETLAPPEIRTRSSGAMEVLMPNGCSVLYNDIGLREQHGSSCTQQDLKSAEKAMTAHLNESKSR
ncbi:MAG: hypothetical protein N838_18515 [Thiohalocapsa sp. PB-PSB1]|jgi:hypothetical protein|nr:MAG: hypothetical protein N838_18515 [Thiohalocapsa sp. PB-PSB1]